MCAFKTAEFYRVFEKVNKRQYKILFFHYIDQVEDYSNQESGHEHFNNRLFIRLYAICISFLVSSKTMSNTHRGGGNFLKMLLC